MHVCCLFLFLIINFKMNTIDKSGLVEFQQRKIYNCWKKEVENNTTTYEVGIS